MPKEDKLDVSTQLPEGDVGALFTSKSILVHCSSVGWESRPEAGCSGATWCTLGEVGVAFSQAEATGLKGRCAMGSATCLASWLPSSMEADPARLESASTRGISKSGGRSPPFRKIELVCSLTSSVKKQPALRGKSKSLYIESWSNSIQENITMGMFTLAFIRGVKPDNMNWLAVLLVKNKKRGKMNKYISGWFWSQQFCFHL